MSDRKSQTTAFTYSATRKKGAVVRRFGFRYRGNFKPKSKQLIELATPMVTGASNVVPEIPNDAFPWEAESEQ